MNRRSLQIVTAFNVIGAAVLFLWWQLLPGTETSLAETAIDHVPLDLESKLERINGSRESWRAAAGRYRAFAGVALLLLGANALYLLRGLVKFEIASSRDRVATQPDGESGEAVGGE